MEYKLSKEIYSKQAILKTAYKFTDDYYVHLDSNHDYYLVSLFPKNDDSVMIQENFQNEVLCYMVRESVQDRTKNIRELILARAFASTIIENTAVDEPETNEEVDINDILTDWFEKYE